MRRRAFRPEVPGRLEDRSLLSGVAGLPGGPVVLSIPQLNQQIEHMQSSFAYFSRYREIPHLLNELHDDAEMIPFSRADGLDESIDDIVERMQEGLAARAPHPVRSARNELMIVIRSNIMARIRAGDAVPR